MCKACAVLSPVQPKKKKKKKKRKAMSTESSIKSTWKPKLTNIFSKVTKSEKKPKGFYNLAINKWKIRCFYNRPFISDEKYQLSWNKFDE
jgi:hypothetical protein